MLVSWSLTSLFSTNMAISETKGQGRKVIRTQWRKASDILTSTLAAFLFSSHPKKEEGKIQIGKVSKTKIQISHIHTAPKSNRRHKLPTYLLPRSPHGAYSKCCAFLYRQSLLATSANHHTSHPFPHFSSSDTWHLSRTLQSWKWRDGTKTGQVSLPTYIYSTSHTAVNIPSYCCKHTINHTVSCPQQQIKWQLDDIPVCDTCELARLLGDRSAVSASFTAASGDNETVAPDDGNSDKWFNPFWDTSAWILVLPSAVTIWKVSNMY